jgi:restriction system protein
MAKKDTLFAILARAPWWISVAVGAALFATTRLFLPDIAAVASALPFLGIACYAGWRQMRAPGAAHIADTLDRIRSMPWEQFSALIAESFRRDGYAVTAVNKGAVDLQLEKAGRITLVNCKRWKVAQTGIGPLRELLEAREALEAADCLYVVAAGFTANALTFATEKSIRLLHDAALAALVLRAERGKRG